MHANPIPVEPPDASKPRRRMTTRNRILFLATGWLIVSMPFLFWWNTWFGRQLSDQRMAEYLQDDKKPRHIQHALVQIGERIGAHDTGVSRWYPDVVRLAAYPVDEVRNTDAWVMGQDTSGADFHQALLKMLNDSSLMVRGNAALSLVRFGDASGRPQIVALIEPAQVNAPQSGKVTDTASAGTAIHQGGTIAKLQSERQIADGQSVNVEVRSPISGRLRNLYVQVGQDVTAGTEVAVIEPADDQVWEALRALYLIGQPEDLPAILPYERDVPEISDRIRQQATLTEQAIRGRAK
jgi:hypothetical protein